MWVKINSAQFINLDKIEVVQAFNDGSNWHVRFFSQGHVNSYDLDAASQSAAEALAAKIGAALGPVDPSAL